MASLAVYRNLYTLHDKVAVVAGGAGGIGRAICEGLAAFGATVVVADINQSTADCVAAEITAAGGKAWGAVINALDVSSTRQAMSEIATRAGSLDVLVNAVGTHREAPAEAFTEADWDLVVDLNLKAAFFLSQAAATVQIPQGGGKQIHITSVRSLLGIQRGYVAYCASKGGMNLMIKQLATEWAKYHISVNGIAPTFTRTELVKNYLEDPDFYNPLVARIPLGRICEPQDLAALAIYLAVPASDFITGQIIFADGGVTATQ
ncbi:MAG: SDR family oxidoreductase [Anaerolineae bacterium]|nr:SDR family oxidoreductase [Anaerolineae bacterium]